MNDERDRYIRKALQSVQMSPSERRTAEHAWRTGETIADVFVAAARALRAALPRGRRRAPRRARGRNG